MDTKGRYARMPAIVFGRLLRDEIRIELLPGNPFADGGAPIDVPLETIPAELRIPNTLLWVSISLDAKKILRIWRRHDDYQ
jgi:hypothetical protein